MAPLLLCSVLYQHLQIISTGQQQPWGFSQQPQENWPISRGPRTWPGAGTFGCVLAEALSLAMHWKEHAESVRHLRKVPNWATDFKNLHQAKMSYKQMLLSPAFNPTEPAWSAIGHALQLSCPVALCPQVGRCLPCLSPCPGLEFTMNPSGSLLRFCRQTQLPPPGPSWCPNDMLQLQHRLVAVEPAWRQHLLLRLGSGLSSGSMWKHPRLSLPWKNGLELISPCPNGCYNFKRLLVSSGSTFD